jgi:hypothetical protein
MSGTQVVLTGHTALLCSRVGAANPGQPHGRDRGIGDHRQGRTPSAPGTDLVKGEFRGVRGPAGRSPGAQHEQKGWRQLIATQLLEIFGLGIDNGPADAIPDAAARLVHYHALRRGPAGAQSCARAGGYTVGASSRNESRRRLFPCGHRVPSSGPGDRSCGSPADWQDATSLGSRLRWTGCIADLGRV